MRKSPRPFSPNDIATIKRMAQSGRSDGEIARHLGRGRIAIVRKRAALGIERGLSPAMLAVLGRFAAMRRGRRHLTA